MIVKPKERAMKHDFESKEWADNHHKLSEGIDGLFGLIVKLIGRMFGMKSRVTKEHRRASKL
jgi:hypothetical protein